MSRGFITQKSALYAKHRQRATHGKDGRSIVHRRASQGNWKKTNSRHWTWPEMSLRVWALTTCLPMAWEIRENFHYTQGPPQSICCEGTEIHPAVLTGAESGSAVIRNDSGSGINKTGLEFPFHHRWHLNVKGRIFGTTTQAVTALEPGLWKQQQELLSYSTCIWMKGGNTHTYT